MQGVANGTGPNPAQAMLANTTGQNVANQQAQMAGQRGSGANVGLMARQAANNGANIQQQAAGQGAALQAQQSLGALGQMGGMANQMAGQQANATNAYSNAAQNAYGQTSGNINAQNNANIQNTGNMNNVSGQIANGVAQQQGNMFGNMMGSLGSGMQMLPGLMSGGAGAGAAAGGAGMAGGAASAIGPASMMLALAEGGNVPKVGGPQSHFGRMMAEGGKVPAMVSPGEKYLTPQQASQVTQGKANAMTAGKTIPGKPQVGGAVNSYANDTVPATLEEGGIVIPRSVTQGKDAEAKAAAFVKAHFHSRKSK